MICSHCNQEMTALETVSCIQSKVKFPDGSELDPVAYVSEHRCHDCNIAPGGFHHPGCDMEKCPDCNCQLISCGCLDTGEDEEEEEE